VTSLLERARTAQIARSLPSGAPEEITGLARSTTRSKLATATDLAKETRPVKKAIALLAVALAAAPTTAFAAKLKLTGNNGPVTAGSPYTGVVNKGTITGGSSTGLTVTGSAAQKIVNTGTISGSTGISVSGASSVTIINRGTITGGIKIGP
jgi:hypothetical protein